MSRFIRCDRCTLENAIIGTVTLPPGWQTICHADLCERCCETVREFIRFKPSDADKLPVEPIPAEPAPAPSESGDKLFETSPEGPCVTLADSAAAPMTDSHDADVIGAPIPPAGMTTKSATSSMTSMTPTTPSSPSAEASTEERVRTRKFRKLRGQDAILPDPCKPSDPPAPGAPLA